MFETFVPSRIIRPLVPHALNKRFGEQVEQAMDVADAVVAGKDEKAHSLRTALITFSIRIISAFIAYVSQVLMARWLGVHEYGVFVWVWVAAVICGGLACFGFSSAVVKFVPQYRIKNDDPSVRGIVFGARFFSFCSATLIALLGVLGTYLFEDTVTSVYVLPLYLGAIVLPMLALAEVQDGIARSFSWVDLALSPTYLVRPILILAAMAAALGWGMEATAATALIATIGATWFTSTLQLFVINRRLKKTVGPGTRKFSPSLWITVALPIFLVEGFFTLLTNIDIMIAGIYLEPKDVAIYFAAVKTLALVHFVYFAVKAGAAHRYSQYYTAGDTIQFEGFVYDTVRWTFWPSLAMGLFILATGKFLLSLFGSEFVAGYPLLFILVAGIIARASVGPAESVLTMSGQQNTCAAVYGATLFVNIALNLMLIPTYGLYGAAWATTAAMVFEALALYAISLRTLGLHMFVFSATSSPVEKSGEAR